MSEELKNSPIEDFDWEAFEKGETQREKSQEELEKTYDKSLGSFKDHEVTEGTVISINKREVNPMALSTPMNSATILI